jgi:hypothetical protein
VTSTRCRCCVYYRTEPKSVVSFMLTLVLFMIFSMCIVEGIEFTLARFWTEFSTVPFPTEILFLVSLYQFCSYMKCRKLAFEKMETNVIFFAKQRESKFHINKISFCYFYFNLQLCVAVVGTFNVLAHYIF